MSFLKDISDWIIDIFSEAVVFVVNTVGRLGYFGVILLMGIESSFIPFPSEIIVPPAGYLASQGKMNLIVVIICGTVGSILGALVNYFIGAYLGRAFIIKYSKFFLLHNGRFEKFESFFLRHGEITTFVCRLIPGIRQYISFPAGVVKMNIFKFILFTGLGAGIWVIVLALVGYIVGNNIDLVKENLHNISYFLFAILAITVVGYSFVNKYRSKTSS